MGTDGNTTYGDCLSPDSNGYFCFVSGQAQRECTDVQAHSFLKDSNGIPKYYSYEACTTPTIPSPKCPLDFYNPGSESQTITLNPIVAILVSVLCTIIMLVFIGACIFFYK